MPVLYLTFGVRYGDVVDARAALLAGRSLPDPHPTADFASGLGYLAVEYAVPSTAFPGDDEWLAARERARTAAWSWLDGRYAFHYDEPPAPEHAPRGELARMILP